MNEEEKQKIALFRYGIIASAVTGNYDETSSLKGFFRDAAKKVYTNPRGEATKISAVTFGRWFYSYKKGGFDSLIPKSRTDVGCSRRLDNELKEKITFLKNEYPRIPATLIHQKLIDNGTISKGEISLSTVNRFVNRIKSEKQLANAKDMRRYEREHINEVWCGDSSVGPYLTVDGKKQRTYIIALIDDASRMIVGIGIFFNDNFVNLMSVLKTAVTKYGRPQLLNFDNGSCYRSGQVQLLAARIGTVIHYNQPYTPTGKAKIERWFRTMKDLWMSQLNMKEYTSLDMLHSSLLTYADTYNKTPHSSLNEKQPITRFFEEATIIKRLSDDEIEKAFLLEYERRVSADNVIVIDGIEYEVPYKYAKQRITLRYSPNFEKVYVIDKTTNDLTPIKLLNKNDNSHIKREKIKLSGGEE